MRAAATLSRLGHGRIDRFHFQDLANGGGRFRRRERPVLNGLGDGLQVGFLVLVHRFDGGNAILSGFERFGQFRRIATFLNAFGNQRLWSVRGSCPRI
jgi:hypothetical protein